MKLLFASHHSILDPSNGAARSIRDILAILPGVGISCRAFTGAYLDTSNDKFVDVIRGCLEARQIPYEEAPDPPSGGALLDFEERGVPGRVFLPSAPSKLLPDKLQGERFLRLACETMDTFRPDVLLTYGGSGIGRALIGAAKARRVPVVFRIANFAYRHRDLFDGLRVVVPSEYMAAHYARTLSIEATAIPCPIDWSRLELAAWEPRYLTFISPCPAKGGFWAARILVELSRARPDIPILIVEGRGDLRWFYRLASRLGDASRLGAMRTTEDARAFYGITRVLLMPSMHEPFGRVAQEALILKIPIVACRRGGLPEALRGAGTVLDIPPEYHERSTTVPSAEEVQPWIEAILRLWDDPEAYAMERERCAQAAVAYHPDTLAARYRAFFEGAARQ